MLELTLTTNSGQFCYTLINSSNNNFSSTATVKKLLRFNLTTLYPVSLVFLGCLLIYQVLGLLSIQRQLAEKCSSSDLNCAFSQSLARQLALPLWLDVFILIAFILLLQLCFFIFIILRRRWFSEHAVLSLLAWVVLLAPFLFFLVNAFWKS